MKENIEMETEARNKLKEQSEIINKNNDIATEIAEFLKNLKENV